MDEKSKSTPKSAPESAPELLTLRGLAKALGVDAGQMSKESRRPGFPGRATDSGVLYDPAEVRQWRQANVRQKRVGDRPSPAAAVNPGAAAATPTPAMPPGSSRLEQAEARRHRDEARQQLATADDAELLTVLESGNASAIEISRASMQIASRRVARAHREMALGPNDMDGLKKSLQELRTAEADYIALETQRGHLVPRDHVVSIVAEACNRLVRVLSVLENSIATEFSVWLADPKIAAMPADERARLVRGYVAGATRSARTTEADDIARLIATPAAD